MKKTIVILDHNGGRLANQLWNYMGVYAYCMERGHVCENPSFFAYQRYFPHINTTALSRVLSFITSSSSVRIRSLASRYYRHYVRKIKASHANQIISDKREPHVFYLPPSQTTDPEYQDALRRIESSQNNERWYFNGWLFRNPKGFEKYRKEIIHYFSPQEKTTAAIDEFLAPLRKEFSEIIGVHVRQGDYRTWEGGQFYFNEEEVCDMLKRYLGHTQKDKNHVLFLLCSDEPLNLAAFSELHVQRGPGGMIEDLFALAKTDLVIGSDSTYGAFAAYYGNIPFAVFSRSGIDWSTIQLQGGYNYRNAATRLFA